jgi:diaminopimelate epimerase
MRIYNSDGSEPEMCGNGIRCFAQFLKDLGADGEFYNTRLFSFSLINEYQTDERELQPNPTE